MKCLFLSSFLPISLVRCKSFGILRLGWVIKLELYQEYRIYRIPLLAKLCCLCCSDHSPRTACSSFYSHQGECALEGKVEIYTWMGDGYLDKHGNPGSFLLHTCCSSSFLGFWWIILTLVNSLKNSSYPITPAMPVYH